MRYYKKKEYEKLTKDQKAELHRLCKEKGNDGESGNSASNDHKKTISALQSKIDKLESLLTTTISALESRDDDDENERENKTSEKKRVHFNGLTQRS